LLLLGAVVAVSGLVLLAVWRMQAQTAAALRSVPVDDPATVAGGEQVYAAHCASCHGARREGQPDWQRADGRGRLPAPPLDHTGHAWMHADAQLLRTIRDSVYADAPPGYVSDMPAFAGVLSDDAIRAALAFIKSGWPPGVRGYQALLNPDRAGMPPADADWTFPPNCGTEPLRRAQPAPAG
jgi:mono/diheme cytochrome c family protein